MREKRKDTIVKTENVKQSMETEDKFLAVLFQQRKGIRAAFYGKDMAGFCL